MRWSRYDWIGFAFAASRMSYTALVRVMKATTSNTIATLRSCIEKMWGFQRNASKYTNLSTYKTPSCKSLQESYHKENAGVTSCVTRQRKTKTTTKYSRRGCENCSGRNKQTKLKQRNYRRVLLEEPTNKQNKTSNPFFWNQKERTHIHDRQQNRIYYNSKTTSIDVRIIDLQQNKGKVNSTFIPPVVMS